MTIETDTTMVDDGSTTDTADPTTDPVKTAEDEHDVEVQDDGTDEVDEDDDDRGGNSEAAKWRRKFRDAETDRDSARDQLTTQREALLHRAAKDARVTPELLAAAGVTVDTVLDDDGLIDDEAVAAAIDGVIEQYGLPRRGVPLPVGSQGGSRIGSKSSAEWKDILEGASSE